jgi:hypothetical protein
MWDLHSEWETTTNIPSGCTLIWVHADAGHVCEKAPAGFIYTGSEDKALIWALIDSRQLPATISDAI